MKMKKMDLLMQLYRHFVTCPPLATCLAWGVPKDPRPGSGSCRRSKRAWEAAGLWQTWLAFCSVFQLKGHLEVNSVAKRKGEAVAEVWLGSLS